MTTRNNNTADQYGSPPCTIVDRQTALATTCQQAGVEILYAFGSRASEVQVWLQQPAHLLPPGPSDIDIGVKATHGKLQSVDEKVRLAIALEDLFGCERVDLVVLDDTDPFLAAEVIRGERLFAQDEFEADEYDLYVLRRAGDLEPLERERIALILGKRP